MISLFWSVMARVREVIVSFLSFLYCGDWGSKCVKYSGPVTKYVNKVLLSFPSLRLSELSSSFKLMVIFVPLTNLLVLCISLPDPAFAISAPFLSVNLAPYPYIYPFIQHNLLACFEQKFYRSM